MAKRHKGTTTKGAPKPRSTKRAETPGASGADMLRTLERTRCEALVLETLNALGTRTARPDGRRCQGFQHLGLATQYEAACLYLLDHKSLAEVAELVDLSAVSTRVAERWIKIVKEEYGNRYNAVLRQTETDAALAAHKGDMAALSGAFWGELVVAGMTFLKTVTFADMDNNTRHLMLRMGEGTTDQAKVQAEIAKARAQTEKLRRQLLHEVDEAGKRGNGKLSVADVARIIETAVGLPGGMLGGEPGGEVAA